MFNYFDDKNSEDAFQYAVSMVTFMDTISCSYLNTIGASNFDYIEYHRNGNILNLTNNKMLLMERFQRKMKYQILFADIVFSMAYHQPKVFLWPDNPLNQTLEILFQLDVWNGCNVFIRQQDAIIVFSFSGSKSSYNIRYNCNNNQPDLFLFIHHATLLIQRQLSVTRKKYIHSDITFYVPEQKPMIKRLEIERGIILTHKELEIAKYISCGHSASYIAEKCLLSQRTVESHIQTIKEKIYDAKNESLTKQGLIDFFYQKKWLLESIV